uniref:Uncharacterized protein n=1 Tax=Strigamia maritima TaxID=126957 RepID=T1IP36_STRMM
MLKIYMVALVLASTCETGSSTFIAAALKTLFNPPNLQQSAPPALPPYPTYKAFVDPNPPKPPIRPNYVPKPFPDYKVSFASPGMGIGTNGIQLTYANNYMNPSALLQYSSANNYMNPSALQFSSANNYMNPSALQFSSANNYMNPSALQYGSGISPPSPSLEYSSGVNPPSPSLQYSSAANPPSPSLQYSSTVNSPSPIQYSSALNYPSLQYSSGLSNAPAIPDQVYYSNKPSSDYSQINSQTLTSQFDIAVPAGSTIDFHIPAQFQSTVLNQDSKNKNIPIPIGEPFGQAHVSSGIEVGLNDDSKTKPGQVDQEAIQQLPQPSKLESSSGTALKISTDEKDKNTLNIDIHPDQLGKAINQQESSSFSMDALTKDFRLVLVTNQNDSAQDNTEAQSPRSIFKANQAGENRGLSAYVNTGPAQGVNLGPFYTPQPLVPNDPVVKLPSPTPIPDPIKVETVPEVTEATKIVNEAVDDAPVEPERTPIADDAPLSAPAPVRTPIAADAPLSAPSSGGFGNFFPGGFNNLPGLLSSAMGNARNPVDQSQGFSPQGQGFGPQNQGFAPQSQEFVPQNQGFAPNIADSSVGFDTPNSFQGAYYSPQQFQPYGPMFYQPGYSYGDGGSSMYAPTVMQADDYGPPEELETMTVLLDPSNEMNLAPNHYGSSSGGHSYEHRPNYNKYMGSHAEGNQNENTNYRNPGVSQPDDSNYRNTGIREPDNSDYKNTDGNQPDDSNYRNTGIREPDNSNYQNTGIREPDNSNYQNTGIREPDNSNYQNTGIREQDNSNYQNTGIREPDNSNYRNTPERQPDNSNYQNTGIREPDNSNYRNTPERQPDNSNYRNTPERQPDTSNYQNSGVRYPDNSDLRNTEVLQLENLNYRDSEKDNANFHNGFVRPTHGDVSQQDNLNSYVNHQENFLPVNPNINNLFPPRPYYNGPKSTENANYYHNQGGIQQPDRPVIYVDQQESFVPANDNRQTVSTYIEDIEKIPNYFQPPVVDQVSKGYDSGPSYSAIPKGGFNSVNQDQSDYHHSNAQNSDKFDNIGSQMEEFDVLRVEPNFHSSTVLPPNLEIIETASSQPRYSVEPEPYSPDEYDQAYRSHQYENEASHKNSENTDFLIRAPVVSDTNPDYEYKPVLLVGPFYQPTEPNKQSPIDHQSENVEQNVVSDIGRRVYPTDDEEEKTSQDVDDSVDSQYQSTYIQMESASAYPVYDNAITPHTILRSNDGPVPRTEYKPIALIGPFGGYNNNLRGKSLDDEQLVGDYDTIQASSIAPFPKRTPVIRKKPMTDNGLSMTRVHTQFSTSDFQEKWRNDLPYFEHTSPSEVIGNSEHSTPYEEDKNPEHVHFETAQQPTDAEYNPILMAGPFLEPPIAEDTPVEPVQEEYVPVLVAGPLTNKEDAQNLVGDAVTEHPTSENDEEDDLMLPPNRDAEEEYKPLLIAGPFQPKGDDGSTDVTQLIPTTTEVPPVPPKAYERWRTPSPRRKFTINSKRKMNEFYPTTYHPVTAEDDSFSNDVVTDVSIQASSSSNVEHLNDEGIYGMKIHPKLVVKTV